MQVIINQDLCMGCGICANMCASCFQMGDDLKSHLVEGCDCATEECCEQAVNSCPVQAIEIAE